jgi:hypothetical protein
VDICNEGYYNISEKSECFICKDSTYNFEKNSSRCYECPIKNGAKSCYLNVIEVKEGFWRSGNKSSNL